MHIIARTPSRNRVDSPATPTDVRHWLQPTRYDDDSSEYQKNLSSLHDGTGTWLTATPEFQFWLSDAQDGPLLAIGPLGSGKSVLASKIVHDLAESGGPVLYCFSHENEKPNRRPSALMRKGADLDDLHDARLWELLRMGVEGAKGRIYCVVDALDEVERVNPQLFDDLADFASLAPENVRIFATTRTVSPHMDANFSASHIRIEPDDVERDISAYVASQLRATNLSAQDHALALGAILEHANGLFLYAKLAFHFFLKSGVDARETAARLPANLNTLYGSLADTILAQSHVEADVQRLIFQAATYSTRPLQLVEMADMLLTAFPSLASNLSAINDIIRRASEPLLEILTNDTVTVVHHSFTEFLRGTTRVTDDDRYPVLDASEAHLRLHRICVEYLSRTLEEEWQRTQQLPDSNVTSIGDLDTQATALIFKYPLMEYSARSWAAHLGHTDLTTQKSMNESVHALFQKPLFRTMGVQLWWLHSKYFDDVAASRRRANEVNFNVETWPDYKDSWTTLYGSSHLHLAARLGLAGYAEYLVFNGEAVDVLDDDGKTPLYWAAEHGQADVVRVLIASCAIPDAPDSVRGLKPLHQAALKNHARVASVLLEAGVSPSTKKTMEEPETQSSRVPVTKNDTPWLYVYKGAHLETLEAFLPYMDDAEMLEKAAWITSINNNASLLSRLLRHPIIAKKHQKLGWYLLKSCEHLNLRIARLLLAAGADPNFRHHPNPIVRLGQSHMIHYSPLEAACKRPAAAPSSDGRRVRSKLVDLLVEHGANVRDRGPSLKGNTALHLAADYPDLVCKLLNLGMDANEANNHGDTPLHLTGNPDSVVLLVEKGRADTELCNMYGGRTPLLQMLATCKGRRSSSRNDAIASVRKLLEFKPDCTVADNRNRGALHFAVQAEDVPLDIISQLLEAGADPNKFDVDGTHALHLAKEKFSKEKFADILSLFRRAGLDIDARDASGKTALFRLFDGTTPPSKSRVAMLLEMGASLDTRDAQGRTLLHQAIKFMEPYHMLRDDQDSPFQNLLDLGLDPRDVDDEGNTLLHKFSIRMAPRPEHLYRNADEREWDLLVNQLGLDVNQANHLGRTPLHVLAAHVEFDYRFGRLGAGAQRILSHSRNLNVQDIRGVSPLHLATTSRTFTWELLQRGADPKLKTRQGLTPLHLAVRAGDSDVVGILLDALAGSSDVPGAWYFESSASIPGIDSPDERGWTALSYACRAGRPDLVDLLLKAGANPRLNANIEACSQFEDEIALWHAPEQESSPAAMPTIEETARPRCTEGGNTGDRALCTHATTRLDDVLELLLKAGDGDSQQYEALIALSSSLETSKGMEYTRFCVSQAIWRSASRGHGTVVPLEVVRDMRHFCDEYLEGLRISQYGYLGAALLQPGRRYMRLFLDLMHSRCHELVLDLPQAGIELAENDLDVPHSSAMACLIKGGFARLVRETLDGEARPPPLKRRREFWVSQKDASPFLLTAVETQNPNLQVLEVLVGQRDRTGEESPPGLTSSQALRHLAKGKSWWHVALALPFLIERGVDVSIILSGRNSEMLEKRPRDEYDPYGTPGLFRDYALRLLTAATGGPPDSPR
ncbi:ankyrin repeat-containing domain protein [Plectosphaerella cucumerina]|uniref:Ankyrin repeat-containing domain protein n=1 Tax=Plectosphaerella cucumerina TaxID=40658 RepID=A0A8K0TNF7_9PEZI|nr:ankyrin repeat-containing domain protein [Plectosphaerella cucumerina]